MKVIQINTVYGTGSTGRIAKDLQRYLREHGHDCLVCYGRGDREKREDSYRISGRMGVYLHALLSRITDKQGLYSTCATRTLTKKIKEYAPDVIHLHNIHGYYLNYKQLFHFLAEYAVPVVWTLHDCWPFTGHCAHFEYTGCEKWQTLCCQCPQKTEYPASYVIDNSEGNYKLKKEIFQSINNMTIVTPSEWLAAMTKKSFLKKHPVRIIRNGVDREIFKPRPSDIKARFGISNKKIVLGVANVWNKKKGLFDFFELAELLAPVYKVVLIGLAKEQLATLPKEILGIPRTKDATELAEWYTCAEVFVNPTYEDTYPTTNLEAEACGTPVITYQTGGSTESVRPEFVVEKGNIPELKKRIENIDPSTHAIPNITLDKNESFEQYLSLYSELTHE